MASSSSLSERGLRLAARAGAAPGLLDGSRKSSLDVATKRGQASAAATGAAQKRSRGRSQGTFQKETAAALATSAAPAAVGKSSAAAGGAPPAAASASAMASVPLADPNAVASGGAEASSVLVHQYFEYPYDHGNFKQQQQQPPNRPTNAGGSSATMSWFSDGPQSRAPSQLSMSLSDLSIVACEPGSGRTETFHVHRFKVALDEAVGQRHSMHLKAALLPPTPAEEDPPANPATSAPPLPSVIRVSMPPSAFGVFPKMLTYIYDGSPVEDESAEGLVAVRCLAQYFGIRSLYEDTNADIRGELGHNAKACLIAAVKYNDGAVIAAALDAARRAEGDFDWSLMENINLELFQLHLMDNPDFDGVRSEIVANFISYHEEGISASVLAELTARMTHVDEGYILTFLCLDQKHGGKSGIGAESTGRDEDGEGEGGEAPSSGSSLRQRCLDSIPLSWEYFPQRVQLNKMPGDADLGEDGERFRLLHPDVRASVIATASLNAETAKIKEIAEKDKEIAECKRELAEMKGQVEEMTRRLAARV